MKFIRYTIFVLLFLAKNSYQYPCEEYYVNNSYVNPLLYTLPNAETTQNINIIHTFVDSVDSDSPCLLMSYNKEHCGPIFFKGNILLNREYEFSLSIFSLNSNRTILWKTKVDIERVSQTYPIYKLTFVKAERYKKNIDFLLDAVEASDGDYKTINIPEKIADRFDSYITALHINGNKNMVAFATCKGNENNIGSYYEEDIDFYESLGGFILAVENSPADEEFLTIVTQNNRFSSIVNNNVTTDVFL